jgi:protein-S-isoprenylcysteine O-methyltransferase Ste14
MTLQRFVYENRGPLIAPPLLLALLYPRGMAGHAREFWVAGLFIFGLGMWGRVWAQQHLHFRLRDVDNALTRTGPYRWVRNPIYISNTLLCVGLTVFSENLWLVPVTVAWCLGFYTIVIKEEEERLLELYGTPYGDYLRETSRWLPRRSAAKAVKVSGYLPQSLIAEAHNLLLLIPFIVKRVFW